MTRQNGVNVHKFCSGLGIRVRPVEALKYSRAPNTVYGGRTIARLIGSHGEEHVYRVLRCIQTSSKEAFFGDMIIAVHRYIATHRAEEGSQALLKDFAAIDLLHIRRRARRLSKGMTKQADALSILIADYLEQRESTEDKAA